MYHSQNLAYVCISSVAGAFLNCTWFTQLILQLRSAESSPVPCHSDPPLHVVGDPGTLDEQSWSRHGANVRPSSLSSLGCCELV